MLHTIFLTLNRLHTGRTCRRCGDNILPGDQFGYSESVCRPCRG